MQREITDHIDLLDERGHITEEGWARHPLWRYDRSAIRASKLRIKEWDYYAVLSQDGRYGVTFTMSDLGYTGLFAVCWLDLEQRTFHQVDTLKVLPLGRTGLGHDSDLGRVSFTHPKLELEFVTSGDGTRTLHFSSPVLEDGKGNRKASGKIVLHQEPELESVNIATSWKENRRAFYYNRKLNCLPAEGVVVVGDREYRFSPDRDLGCLDWGRGNWTYKNRWFWGSASTRVDGVTLGWNVGYGFSDRTPASENAIIYNDKVHKLDEVEFHFDPSDYMKPWRFTSSDGRFELDFEPSIDRSSEVNFLAVRSIQHQVFGTFNGTLVLDTGQEIEIENVLGFAEDVLNWW